MGQSYNSGSTTAKINGNITVVPQKFTAVPISTTTSAVNNTQTIGTVPVGKVWRIVTAWLACNIGLDAVSQGIGTLQFNSVVVFRTPISSNTNITIATSVQNNWSYDAAPVLTAGQTVTVVSATANLRADGGVSYVEENA